MAGTATPRHTSVTAVFGDDDQIPAPPGVQQGDILLAWVTTLGADDDVGMSGGGPWVPLAENTSVAYTVLFGQVAGATNPSMYRPELGPGDAGFVALAHLRGADLADLVITSTSGGSRPSGGVPCPPADPGVAGGAEIRFAYAYSFDGDLTYGSAYPREDQAATGADAVYLGSKTAVNSNDLPARTISTGGTPVEGWQAWTVIVGPSDTVPPPPPAPEYAVTGLPIYRYTAHDFLTGTYIDDIYPRDVEYCKFIRTPAPFTGNLPIPNSRVAAAVRRIIPQTRADLTTGPGRIEIRIWRDGELRGRYWLTGAQVRSTDGKVSIELRGSTFDAYWYSLAVQYTLNGGSFDQVATARTYLAFALDDAEADLAIRYQTGNSGVVRPYLVKTEDNTSYGRSIEEFSKSVDGFEYFLAEGVDEDGVYSEWRWASPKFDTGRAHVVSMSPQGGDMIEYGADIDALRGGNNWRVRGGTLQPDPEEDGFALLTSPIVTPHVAAGAPRIDRIIDHPTQSTDVDELNALNAYNAEIGGGALWVRTVTVVLSKKTTLTMNSLGDQLRMLITDVWHPPIDGGAGLDISERILEIRVRPNSRGQGKEVAVLTLESVEVS